MNVYSASANKPYSMGWEFQKKNFAAIQTFWPIVGIEHVDQDNCYKWAGSYMANAQMYNYRKGQVTCFQCGNASYFGIIWPLFLIWLIWSYLWLIYCLQISNQASSVPDLTWWLCGGYTPSFTVNYRLQLATVHSVATVQTGVFANLSNEIAKITKKIENVDEAKIRGVFC